MFYSYLDEFAILPRIVLLLSFSHYKNNQQSTARIRLTASLQHPRLTAFVLDVFLNSIVQLKEKKK